MCRQTKNLNPNPKDRRNLSNSLAFWMKNYRDDWADQTRLGRDSLNQLLVGAKTDRYFDYARLRPLLFFLRFFFPVFEEVSLQYFPIKYAVWLKDVASSSANPHFLTHSCMLAHLRRERERERERERDAPPP